MKHSKEIFDNLNTFKLNLSLLEREIASLVIPTSSSCTKENIEQCIKGINEVKETGNLNNQELIWNEEGYHALHNHFLKRVRGEHVAMDIQVVFRENKIEKIIDFGATLRGKYDARLGALLLIVKNSQSIKAFLSNSSPCCAVSYVEALKGKVLRGITTIAFSK